MVAGRAGGEVMVRSPGRFTEISQDECLELMATTTVGWLAFVDAEGQQLLPVNFVLHGQDVYFRTMSGSAISSLADGHDDVAFAVDHHDDIYQKGWDVMARGTTARVDDPDLVAQVAAGARPRPWAPGERDVLIVLRPSVISGRRVRRQ
ncbi:pyridoxamine 5'-phosphate oxidase family protein [Aeromicrobium yanjiei]|uniref:Pyridoxamine 5'-phosphate oxidase family protein n=2 Tax=Aeromicrobium yanjiei TaxID=2662028 RepID=A0A5Q2MPE9_9ACTN|nr:pyridoxamine 5'-phosphate oxidase family protein [Aeromicrobium yanjiei]